MQRTKENDVALDFLQWWNNTGTYLPRSDYKFARTTWDAAITAERERAGKVCEDKARLPPPANRR